MATKTDEKGLLIVHTGTGKGKTDRRVRHGVPAHRPRHAGRASCSSSSRRRGTPASATLLAKFPDLVTLHIMGEGFTWETQDRERDIAAAAQRPGNAPRS